MAYIPKDDENQQSGMNVLAPQQAGQNNNQNQPDTASQNVSGGQSATIGSGQSNTSQSSQNTSNSGGKRAKSGMFTNLRKYINQNQAGAQNISSRLQQNASQENTKIQQAISKQKNDFASRVDSNRNRMQQAQQFGQQAVQQASAQESMPYLQQQAADKQERIDSFQPINNQQVLDYQNYLQKNQQGPMNFSQFADQNLGVTQNQQQLQQQQQTYQQEQDSLRNSIQNYGQNIDLNQAFGQEARMADFLTGGGGGYNSIYYNQDQFNQKLLEGDEDIYRYAQQKADQDAQTVQSMEEYVNRFYPNATEQQINQSFPGYSEAKNRLESFQSLKAQRDVRDQALQTQNETRDRLAGLQDQYNRAQEQQRLFENKQQLEGELSQIQNKIDNAPEQLTEDDIKRFNDLRTGVERFDNAILNLSAESRQAQDIMDNAQRLQTNQGRREALRETFGAQGGYTSGQASLDNLILTGNKDATRDLIQNARSEAQETQNQLQEAFRQGRISQDELTRGTQALQRELEESISSAEQTLMSDLESRVQSGEGTYIKELADKLNSGQGLSEEDMNILGLTGEERYNIDPTTLLSQYDPTQYNIQDVANLTDVARAQSLARLSGEDQQTMLLNEQEIANRNLRGEGDQQTRTLNELSAADRAGLQQFKDDLSSGQKYANVDDAIGGLRSQLSNNYGDANVLGGSVLHLVTNGSTGTNYGNVNLEDAMAGDPQTLWKLQNVIYWNHVGRSGRHGVTVPFSTIQNMITHAVEGAKTIGQVYSGQGSNVLKRENATNFEGIDEARQKIRRIV